MDACLPDVRSYKGFSSLLYTAPIAWTKLWLNMLSGHRWQVCLLIRSHEPLNSFGTCMSMVPRTLSGITYDLSQLLNDFQDDPATARGFRLIVKIGPSSIWWCSPCWPKATFSHLWLLQTGKIKIFRNWETYKWVLPQTGMHACSDASNSLWPHGR